MDFKIDKEFRDLIPPLSDEEFSQLEASILAEGVRDPLVVWANNGNVPTLVEGHHRWQVIRKHGITDYRTIKRRFPDRDAVRCWIIDNQCGRRNLPRYTKTMLQILKLEYSLRLKAKENQGRRSDLFPNSGTSSVVVDEELAKAAGVSTNTVERVRFLMQHAAKDTLEELQSGQLSINEAFTAVRTQVYRDRREEEHRKGEAVFRKTKIEEHQNVLHGDFRDLTKELTDNSVDLIFCDPPYALEEVHLYGDLARIGARVLKPGAALLCYCGNKFLPQVLELMTPHLKFYWTMACIHSGNNAQEQHHRNVGIIGTWKPILFFVKEKRRDRGVFVRDSVIGEYDKRFHPFGQGVAEARYFIEKLTMPGQTVADFFAGGGTTLVAAKESKRKWWGCDIDEEAVRISRQRITEMHL